MSPRILAGLLSATALLAAASASATTCAEVRVGPHVAAQPEPWRRAVEALVQSTTIAGLPWSCPGGEVDLVANDAGARLTVTDAGGRAVVREVATPEEVQPLGEALLARPLPPPPPAAPPEDPKVPEPSLPDPRLLLAAQIGPRYAGKTNALWGGVRVDATVPFGAWGAGISARYDGPKVAFEEHQPSIQEVVVAAAVFRAFDVGPLALRAGLRPAAAIMLRGKEHSGDRDTRVTLRVGAEAQLMIPITKTFRAVVGFDAEIAPLDLSDHPPPDMDRMARMPAYTLGLGAGLEVAIR